VQSQLVSGVADNEHSLARRNRGGCGAATRWIWRTYSLRMHVERIDIVSHK